MLVVVLSVVLAAQTALPGQTLPVGTVLIAHGGGAEWNAQVLDIAAQVQTTGPVEVSFLMGPGARSSPFQAAVRHLADAGVHRIVVVPLLVSSHSGHYEQIRYLVGATDSLSENMRRHLEAAGIKRPDVQVQLVLSPAMDDAPEIAHVLAERARTLASDPSAQALFVVGHGPSAAEDYAAWMTNLRVLADTVRATTDFRDVRVGVVRDDAPAPVRAEAVRQVREMIQLQHELTGRDVIVVPLLVSRGRITKEKLPSDLAGLPIVYSGEALLPHPGVARWIEARVRDWALAGRTNEGS